MQLSVYNRTTGQRMYIVRKLQSNSAFNECIYEMRSLNEEFADMGLDLRAKFESLDTKDHVAAMYEGNSPALSMMQDIYAGVEK